ncbi:LemA family protein [Lactobacillus sp. S2-2]|uniref:LemA family protein n=1 Tax=Lactobacillus sp. S2-2 TaxID=2692917 RepID=UPI001F2EAADB|nr:LemA family protein [Lactobacillus sp. S2-2]MCF6515229.1 LemA family protein [Lactobacillus sp. S2-2]
MKSNKKFYVMLTIIVVLILGWVISANNSLNKQKQAVEGQWGQVQNQMQRRADLTPQLLSVVRGNMDHEDNVFNNVANARKQYSQATNNGKQYSQVTASKKQTESMDKMQKQTSLLMNSIYENYPKLASSKQINKLMTQLEGSENRLAQERRVYNQKVQDYNTSISSFPNGLMASLKGFKSYHYYKPSAGSDKAPKVGLE